MAITARIEAKAKPIVTYPMLGKYECYDFVILFTETNTGTIILGDMNHETGHYAEDWTDDWDIFTGEITLSNRTT